MDLDSDYCSNDSEANFHSSSRTPTPPNPKLELLNCSKNNIEDTNTTRNHTKTIKKYQKGSDSVTFKIGNCGERVEVHNISKIAWKVPILKSQILNAATSEIEVVEWEPTVFKLFLKYLETDIFKVADFTGYVELIRLCIAYNVPKLLAQVCPFVKQNITLENCVEIYKLAAANDLDDLRTASYNYILRMGNSILEHPSFLDLDCITLSILISSDDFPIVEVTLFNRLKDWVTAQCKRLNYPPDRKEFFGRVAGLLFDHVRYAQMTPKEFRNHVIPSGLLSKKDVEAINLRHRTHPGLWFMIPPCSFVDRPRMAKLQFSVPLYNNVQIGFHKIAGTNTIIQESVRFLVSHDIYLTSIGFYGPAKSDRSSNGTPLTAYAIKILVEGDYSKYYCRCPAQNATIITRDNFMIDLNQPLRIQKLEPYKLTVWIDGEQTQFGKFPLPQAIVLIQDKGEVITFHFGDADSDPRPTLDSYSGMPSSTPTFPFSHYKFKQESRISGVIRNISFVMKDH